MLGSLGGGEVLVLLVVALFVVGPTRLPGMAKEAGRMLRNLRDMAQGARTQLKSELGPEFGNLDFDSLNPKTFVRKHIFDDKPFFGDDDPLNKPTMNPNTGRPRAADRLAEGERPPFDSDAT